MNEKLHKLKKIIKEFNGIINDFSNKKNFSNLEKMGIYNCSRQLIEGLINHIEPNLNITTYIKNKAKLNFEIRILWEQINDANHFVRDNDKTLPSFLKDVCTIYKIIIDIEENKIDDSEILNISFLESDFESLNEEKWESCEEIKPKFRDFDAFVLKRIKLNNYYIYEIAHRSRTYKQKQTHFIYSNLNNVLYPDNFYTIHCEKQLLKINGIENTNIYRYLLKTKELIYLENKNFDKNLSDWKEMIIKKFQVPPIEYLKAFLYINSREMRQFIKIISSLYDGDGNNKMNNLLNNLIILKHTEREVLENNDGWNPMAFEFWTKNNKGKHPFNMYEKNLFYKIFALANIPLNLRLFRFKANKKFSDELNESENYFMEKYSEWEKDFPDNDFFNNEYEQFKIVEYQEKLTLKKYQYLFESLSSLMEKEQKYNENFKIDLNNDLASDKIKAFKNAIKNSRTIIIGPAGYGKTKLCTSIIKELEERNEKILFLGPTHKATRVIDELHDDGFYSDSYTVQKITSNFKMGIDLTKNFENIIIDEISMIEDENWVELSEILKNKKRVILIGDSEQIKPINSFGAYKFILNEFKDITFELTKNYRQTNKTLEQEINYYRENGKLSSQEFVKSYNTLEDFFNIIKNNMNFDVYITPFNYGIFGTKNINQFMSKVEDLSFLKNDTIILNEDLTNINKGLYTNRILTIKNIINKKIIFIDKIKSLQNWDNFPWQMENGELTYHLEENEDIIPFSKAKSITMHSSQGSTFKEVCVIFPPGWNFKKSMIYTAISRSIEKLLVIIYKGDLDKIIEYKN